MCYSAPYGSRLTRTHLRPTRSSWPPPRSYPTMCWAAIASPVRQRQLGAARRHYGVGSRSL